MAKSLDRKEIKKPDAMQSELQKFMIAVLDHKALLIGLVVVLAGSYLGYEAYRLSQRSKLEAGFTELFKIDQARVAAETATKDAYDKAVTEDIKNEHTAKEARENAGTSGYGAKSASSER